MVNKIGRLFERVGVKDLPQNFSRLSDTSDIDNIVITSDKDDQLFEEFEEIIHSTYSDNNLIGIYADPSYADLIEESDKIHEDVVNFFRYENGAPTTQMADLLSESANERSLLIASKDYISEFRENVESEIRGYEDEFIGLYR